MCSTLSSLLFELSKSHHTLTSTKQLHALIIKTHLISDPFYATKTIRFYANNNDLHSAHILFDKTPNRSVYLWNSIIRAYAQHNRFNNAFSLLIQMRRTYTKPDNYTFACILRAFMEKSDPLGMRTAHAGLVVMGLGLDSVCSSALISAYWKLGFIGEARKVFDGILEPDLVMWNSMIAGFGYTGFWNKCLELFGGMRNMGRNPDGYTLVGVVSGLVDSSLLVIGQGIHGFCLKSGFDSNVHVRSSLVSMYSRCDCLYSAYRVFISLSQPDLVQWSALITGFSQSGDSEEAVLLFKEMNVKGVKADHILIASVLAACGRMAMVGLGREVHGYVFRRGFQLDVMVASALVDMYLKCGFASLGVQVFETLPEKNVVAYNSVISGLGSHGLVSKVFEIFEKMLDEGSKPDASTFSALLSACSHAGFVNDGREVFRRMEEEFGVQPRTEHYVYMVKLLGMAGELEDAYSLIQTMPVPMDSGVLGALLSCCVTHGNFKLGEIVARQLNEIDPGKTSYKVMLSNIYAGSGKWDDANKLRDDMLGAGYQKTPGLSWIG